MTAPLLQSAQYNGTTLYIIFDRAVSASSPQLNGFTFTRNGSPETPSYVSITQNAIVATLTGAVTSGVTVAYNSGSGSVVEAASPNTPLATFTTTAAVAYYSAETVLAVTINPASAGNNKLVLTTSQPLGSTNGNLIDGFTITINDVEVDLDDELASAVLNANQTALTLTFDSNFTYADDVVVEYSSSTGHLYTWPAGALSTFESTAINLSTDGLPNSAYPLSWVTKYAIEMNSATAVAKLSVSLNPVDQVLVAEYGPIRIATGGTYGVTEDYPSGVAVSGPTVSIVDGVELTQNFLALGDIPESIIAAKDWQLQITAMIALRLGQLRAIDQSVTLGTNTIVSV